MLVIDALQYCNWNRALFEQLRQGGVDCVHVTIAYHETCSETLRNIGAWNRLFEQHGDLIVQVATAEQIEAAVAANKTGVLFGFQNCSPIEDDYALVEIFHTLGVRFMQLTYNNQSPLACGCYEQHDGGLTRFGKQVVDEMNRVGMAVDMSHSAERSTLDAIEYSTRPIAITHANPASFHPAKRNKSDAVLRALGESGGMLGLSAYAHHLRGGADCTLESFCQMAADTAERIGVQHIGIGSDLCQGQPDEIVHWMRNGRWSRATDYGEGSADLSGWPPSPKWFCDNTCFGNLIDGLRQVGFAEDEVRQIIGQNWLDFFAKSFAPQTRLVDD